MRNTDKSKIISRFTFYWKIKCKIYAAYHKDVEAVEYLCHKDKGSLKLLHCRTQDEDDDQQHYIWQ